MEREIKFRYWNGVKMQVTDFHITCFGIVWNEADHRDGSNEKRILMQFTGLKDNRNNREVYECDIYFEEDSQDYGDRRIFFIIAWINERCAFAMLEVSEYNSYIKNGFDAIERDFDGFYFEVMQSSIDKMHYAGNIYEHPHLLTP